MANITIDTSAELNLDMEAMTENTRARYDEFNNRYKQILENDNALNTIVNTTVENFNKEFSEFTSSSDTNFDEFKTAVNEKINKMNRITSVTFTIDGWSSTAPYTQTVALAGATGADDEQPEIFMNVPSSITSDNAEAYVEAFGYITKYDTGVNVITATAMYEKPTADVTVDVKGI